MSATGKTVLEFLQEKLDFPYVRSLAAVFVPAIALPSAFITLCPNAYLYSGMGDLGVVVATLVGAVSGGALVLLRRVRRLDDKVARLRDYTIEVRAYSVANIELLRRLEEVSQPSDVPTPSENGPKESDQAGDRPLGTKERKVLLAIIAVLCDESKLDYKKVSKTAIAIMNAADHLGISISQRAIEEHLKRIPDALATRMK